MTAEQHAAYAAAVLEGLAWPSGNQLFPIRVRYGDGSVLCANSYEAAVLLLDGLDAWGRLALINDTRRVGSGANTLTP